MSPEACPICDSPLPAPAISAPDRLHGTPGEFAVAVCQTCGAGVTLPRVQAGELAPFYPAGYAPYDPARGSAAGAISTAIQAWQGWRARRTPPMSAVAARAPGRGVDVGCGRGDLAAMFAGRGWRMVGVEPSPQACAVARERGIEAREGVLAGVELEPAAYDAALFRQSLEHTVDPVGDLRRVHPALVPDGIVAISVPNFGGWQSRRFGANWYHLDLPRHRTHFTARALDRALRSAGFDDVRVSTSTSLEGLWASLQYRAFGRCLFAGGLGLRVALAACLLGLPIARVANRRGGDLLHAVARKGPLGTA